MVVVVSGIHCLLVRCFRRARAQQLARGAALVSGVLPSGVQTRSGRGRSFAYDAQQLGASSTALWQPGLVPVPENNLRGIKTYSGTMWKGVGLCRRNTCALRVLDGAMPFGSRGVRQELAAEAGRYDPEALATFTA